MNAMGLGPRLKERLKASGATQADLARAIGVSPQAVSKLASGGTAETPKLHQIARFLKTSPDYLIGETDDPSPTFEQVEVPTAVEETINVPMIDLAYGMGGTYLDDDPETRSEPFALSFIRRYTTARAADLVFAEGLGDSMAPTIHTSDLLLIDQSDKTLRVSDQIWAFSFGGVGMIKRLRPRPDGSVAILSDNPNVPEDRAVDDELHLIGRVVAKVSKI